MSHTRQHSAPPSLHPRGAALLGQRIDGRYRVDALLALGGGARIYRAYDDRLNRPVAVKLLDTARPHSDAFAVAFRREAAITARLWHRHIVAIFDRGEHRGEPYMVMEFVDGPSLREVLNEQQRLPLSQAIRICRQLLDALEAAHRAGLVHRDVKPENILLDPHGDVKLIDFGLGCPIGANLASSARQPLLATAAYLAPELLAAKTCDTRADVYAVGIVLFELVTGSVPFDDPNPDEIARRHLAGTVPAPSQRLHGLPGDVDAIVRQATRRLPHARPRDAAALAARLDALRLKRRTHRDVSRRAARRRVVGGAVVVALLAVMAVLGWWWTTGTETTDASDAESTGIWRLQSSDGCSMSVCRNCDSPSLSISSNWVSR